MTQFLDMPSQAPFTSFFYGPHQNQPLHTPLLDQAFKSLAIKLPHLPQIWAFNTPGYNAQHFAPFFSLPIH